MPIQQQDDVTELQAASLQVGLHVLDQGGADVHRLVRVHPGRRLLLPPHNLHNQWGGKMLKLFGHDHLIEVGLLHHKIKAVLLEGEGIIGSAWTMTKAAASCFITRHSYFKLVQL